MSEEPVRHDNAVPVPPFWGARCIEHVPLRAVLPYLNRTALYKFQWGLKPGGREPEAYRAWLRRVADPVLNRLVAESEGGDILRPQAVYGYFPCQSEGEALIVYDDPEGRVERGRFLFPRQRRGRRLCIADFFRPRASGEMDVVAFQVVTVGQRAADHARALFEADRYQDYLYWHGLNVEATEALAEYVHRLIRAELGFAAEDARDLKAVIKGGYRGARYSFGYPACPDLHQQVLILELLDAARIGVRLGEEDQLWPEESTSAIVVHHPQARYFTV
ncbi:vitamin B12 dependent-methionine synthase activation domain-containing protein [Inmirania thermothiophila]|uniref:Cobalamin-dependent methionine synthase-like protein n=1 Tax=Inmirania thermothiophila TaxID=1750597 RepID=A0A3N1YAW1_9GAMM|nr:vitamin B12 dependent-methionine synthase activation domain-containing protein [Inmirania thermothiophila]ROR34772.1 cobalamin-dependent methionine synthase-like protein [Inmirania thermothiophila]